jgi:glycosyltransferase involved in cell wall biosynthesis
MAANSKYKDDIILYGRISEEQLPAVLSAAKALIYVSSFEGFGMPILEAMSCGTPVITSNTSSMPEVAGDAALYADPSNVDEICKCMQDISSSEELVTKLSQNALEQVKKFNWDTSAKRLWEVLSTVVKQ